MPRLLNRIRMIIFSIFVGDRVERFLDFFHSDGKMRSIVFTFAVDDQQNLRRLVPYRKCFRDVG